jgi:hypothetical protein
MQVSNNLIFSSASAISNTGLWINIGQFAPGASLHIVGLESDGSLQVQLSNSLSAPMAEDPTVVALTAIEGLANGAPQIVLATATLAQWLQIVKTPGEAPTVTTVRMLGQIF